MGFTYDPSTAGSSVRFDPPDPRDAVSMPLWTACIRLLMVVVQPITFHRRAPLSLLRWIPVTDEPPTAHPDPTLYPVMLKEFGKRLKRCYGWSVEDFYKAVQ